MNFLANPVCGIPGIPSPRGSWVGVVTGGRCVDLEGTEKAQPFCTLRVEQGRQMRGGSGTCWLRHSPSTLGQVWATLGCGAPACPAGSCIMEITGGESSSRLSLIVPTPHPSFLPSWLSGDQHSRLNLPAPRYCLHTSYHQSYHHHPKASQNICKSPFNTLQRQGPSRSSLNALPRC